MSKSIRTNPRRGDIYDCVFGHFLPEDASSPQGPYVKDNYNFRIPNEIRKRRPVVILGERNNQFIVVPISTKEDRHKNPKKTGEAQQLHIPIKDGCIPTNDQYHAGTKCWAKADLVQTVDVKRLREFPTKTQSHTKGQVSPEDLIVIQKAVMRAIGITEWVRKLEEESLATDVLEEEHSPIG